jgi:pimeloyl-ACP methyl ester carboxylesterase
MPGTFRQFRSGTLYVHAYGGQGRPIVAVHGLGGSHLNWMPVADGLARSGTVTALDLPGFGYSPPGRSFSVVAHARAVADHLESLEEPALLIGNSLGGLITMKVASEFPGLVEGLVLVAPATAPSLRDPRIDREIARRLIIQGLPILGPIVINSYWNSASPLQQLRDTVALVCHHPERVPRDVVEASLVLASARRQQPWAVPALVQTGRSVGIVLAQRRRFSAMVARIGAPTLLIQGAHDRVIAGSGPESLAGQRPDWEYRIMADSGHCPQLEAPEEFVGLFDSWWAGQSRSRSVAG